VCALWGKDKSDEAKRVAMLTDVLADIRDQRAKIKLVFEEGVTSIQNVAASLIDFNSVKLVAEVSSLKGASSKWIGAHVSCFFRVRDREFRNREHFLTFDTSVMGVEQNASGFVRMELTFPKSIRNAQQRRGVRVNVDSNKVPEFLLWDLSGSEQDPRKVDPNLTSEQYKAHAFKVDNFSAGGIRLLVANNLLRAALPEATKGTHYHIFFQAAEDPGDTPTKFWVEAALRNIFHDPETGETSLGMEFVAEGIPGAEDTLTWRPLRFDEVTGLGKFVFKWNLDLYRDKGLGG